MQPLGHVSTHSPQPLHRLELTAILPGIHVLSIMTVLLARPIKPDRQMHHRDSNNEKRLCKDNNVPRSVSENPVVGPRASGFVTGKDGEAGDIGVYRRYSRTQSSRKTSGSKPDRILRQAPRSRCRYGLNRNLECSLKARFVRFLPYLSSTSLSRESSGWRPYVWPGT